MTVPLAPMPPSDGETFFCAVFECPGKCVGLLPFEYVGLHFDFGYTGHRSICAKHFQELKEEVEG